MIHRTGAGSRRQLLLLVLGAAAVGACSRDDVSTNPFDYSTTKDYVVGEAASALGADGKFQLPASVTTPANEISQADAAQIAVGYVQRFGRYHVGRWEMEIGRPIDLDGLSVCDRAFYSRSAYHMPVDAPGEIRRQLGNRWVLSLCDRQGTPTVALSFSPEATELTTDVRASATAVPGAYFRTAGIPARVRGSVPLSPELAAAEASKFALLRVSNIPELVRPAHPESDLLSRWRTPLEAELPLLSINAGASTPARLLNEVFVGFGASFGAIGVLGATSDATVAPLMLRDNTGREWTLQPAAGRQLEWVRRGGVQ